MQKGKHNSMIRTSPAPASAPAAAYAIRALQILKIAAPEQLGVSEIIEGDAFGWEGQARGWGYDLCNSYGTPVAG